MTRAPRDKFAPYYTPNTRQGVAGVGRIVTPDDAKDRRAFDARTLEVYFHRAITEAEMRSFHDYAREWRP